MSDKINSSWFNPWWKALLVITFFPFSLSYFVWRQDWKVHVRLGVIAIIWIIFFGIGSSNESEKSPPETQAVQAEVKATATPMPVVTLEQKQEDFKQFRQEWLKSGQAILIVQSTLSELADSKMSREETYLVLDKLSTMQSNLSSKTFDLKIPDSLKEYQKLNEARSNLGIAAGLYQKSLEDFKKYVDKNDLKALSDAMKKIETASLKMNESADAIDAAARELELDPEKLGNQN